MELVRPVHATRVLSLDVASGMNRMRCFKSFLHDRPAMGDLGIENLAEATGSINHP